MRPQFLQMICLLPDGEVNVILIGGVAANKLIVLKRAAGRPKDLEAIAELEILRAGPKWRGPGLPSAQPE
jgi:hypothetical protein